MKKMKLVNQLLLLGILNSALLAHGDHAHPTFFHLHVGDAIAGVIIIGLAILVGRFFFQRKRGTIQIPR